MNKYTLIKRVVASILAIAVVGGYTWAGIYSGSALMALCMTMMWLGIIGWSFIFLFTWLSSKESALKGDK